MSKTSTIISAVPDLFGFPPSLAVRSNLWLFFVSLSSVFSKTNMGIFPSFPRSFTSKRKWSLGLSLYSCIEN
uniref:Uncharacterized protein n=1 Tax=Monopterus albus TaxID=43700 RepID=A0A3Q3IF12_MONAL